MVLKNYILGDTSSAVARVSHFLSDVIPIFPISPSTAMPEKIELLIADKQKNILGIVPTMTQMQSEVGVAGYMHGSIQMGALTTTFSSSQGLILLPPTMYKIAGEATPMVIHSAAREVASPVTSIFCSHNDIMATRQTGFSILGSSDTQEAQDMAFIAHTTTLLSSMPMLHFFDGYITSAEFKSYIELSKETMKELYPWEAMNNFKTNSLKPENPQVRGSISNHDMAFQIKESLNPIVQNVIPTIKSEMKKFYSATGRKYEVVEFYGNPEAENIIISMTSSIQTIKEYIDLNREEKIAVINIRLYRPFPIDDLIEKLPSSVKNIAVLDRTKEMGAVYEPLCEDVVSALWRGGRKDINIAGGRYGLVGKNFSPKDVKAIFDMLNGENIPQEFTVGINDDVNNLSLEVDNSFLINHKDRFEAIIWGLASDGTSGSVVNSLNIINEVDNVYINGRTNNDARKAGGLTHTHIRIDKNKPIDTPFFVEQPDFIACHFFKLVQITNIFKNIKQNGTILINVDGDTKDVLNILPKDIQRTIKDKNCRLFVINASKIAKEFGLNRRINTIMQVCFFYVNELVDNKKIIQKIKDTVKKTYSSKGEDIVIANFSAIDKALDELIEIKVSDDTISKAPDFKSSISDSKEKIAVQIIEKIRTETGYDIPVSAIPKHVMFPAGLSKLEKRGLSNEVPIWDPDTCIQCGKCAFVCPHSAIRSTVTTEEQRSDAPDDFVSQEYKANDITDSKEDNLHYTIQVSPGDCTGCDLCIKACPLEDHKNPPIKMEPLDEIRRKVEQDNFDFLYGLKEVDKSRLNMSLPKHSQLAKPLFEFSGACPGCGETPLVKLLTQLTGDNLIMANASGCSSVFAGDNITPFNSNSNGVGPAWMNSLYENNAEFGLGMQISKDMMHQYAIGLLKELGDKYKNVLGEISDKIVDNKQEDENSRAIILEDIKTLEDILEKERDSLGEASVRLHNVIDNLRKKSLWIVGGDGWAYDIGYAGIDHILHLQTPSKILVLDNEVYANTGGQQSKATPITASHKFSITGKKTAKKNLGFISMQNNNCYVAQIAMFANPTQTIKAILEAEAFDGPAIIIAHSPCIEHNGPLDTGGTLSQQIHAVNSGQWPLYRFNPSLDEPLQLDSKNPSEDLEALYESQNRFIKTAKYDRENYERLADIGKKQNENLNNIIKNKTVKLT